MAFYANRDPAPGTIGVNVNTNITIDVVSDGFGVDAASVTISVNGSFAWTGDAAQAGFSVVKSVITNGFRYVIDPDAALPGNTTIPLFLYAEDLDSPFNVLNLSWDFDTASTPPNAYILGTTYDFGVSGWLPTVWKYEAGVATRVHVDNVNFDGGTWGSYSTGFVFANFIVVSSGPTSATSYDRCAAYAVAGVWTNLVPPVACLNVRGIYGTGPTDIYIVGNLNGGLGFDNLAVWKWNGVAWTLLAMPVAVRTASKRVGIYSFEAGKFYIYAESGLPPNAGAAYQGHLFYYDGATISDVARPTPNAGGPPGTGSVAWHMLSPTEALHVSTISGTPGTHYVVSWDGAAWTPTVGVPAIFSAPVNFLGGASFDALYGSNQAEIYRINRSANSFVSVYAPGATGGLLEQVRRDPSSGTLATIRVDGSWPRSHYFDSSPDGTAWGGAVVPGLGTSNFNIVAGLVFAEAAAAPDPPSIAPVEPLAGETNVDNGVLIRFSVDVPTALQEPWKIKINRGSGWELAFTYSGGSAVFASAFAGAGSLVTPTVTGFDVVIEPAIPFMYRQRVMIGLAIRDPGGQAAVVA